MEVPGPIADALAGIRTQCHKQEVGQVHLAEVIHHEAEILRRCRSHLRYTVLHEREALLICPRSGHAVLSSHQTGKIALALEFEESHPRTFANMYQFWCQKL